MKYVLNNISTRSITFAGDIFGFQNRVSTMSESESVVASKLTNIIMAYWFCFDKADTTLVTNLSEV